MSEKSSKKTKEAPLKTLIIAEKPSVAKDFVQALPGKYQNQKSYFEGPEYIITFAVGHLVTICTPPEIDEVHKSWSLDNLPILPDVFPLKALDNSKSQLSTIKKLISRKDVGEIINGCDAGREGELIFRYILSFIGDKKLKGKKLSRLWLQSMTKEAILDGIHHLRSDGEMKNLESAAICRSEADWLVGINGSRALTSFKSRFGGFKLTPCGRVQTPTLSMIMDREKERDEFVPQPYWEIEAQFELKNGGYKGKWIDPEFKKDELMPHGRQDRIWKKERADEIEKKCVGKEGEVSETSKPSTQNCPMLYDLTSLQREANARFGLSAKATLDITQKLYDRHKMVTYPRTGSRHLPEDYVKGVKNTIGILAGGNLGSHAQTILDNKWITPTKKIFDNSKVTDHHAIIPTNIIKGDLNDFEAKIYLMILQRFLAIFFPPAKFLNTTRLTVVEGETFKTDGKVLQDPGWRIVYGLSEKEDSILDPIEDQKTALTKEVEILPNETKPPPRFTESTLLSMMESAGKLVDDEDLRDAMKDMGLGTPATRAAIIEGLIKDKYVVRQGKELVPSAKATELMETIAAMKIEELTSPEMTGQWEYKLEQISQGKISREEFMQGIRDLAKSIVKKVKGFDENADKNKEKLFTDEITGLDVYETLSFYESENEKIKIRKFLGGRAISHEEVKTLLAEKKLGPLTGFISKAGKPFSAMIKLKPDYRVEFVFEDQNAEKPDFSKLKYLGVSPVDGSKVYEGEMSYVSESLYDKESKTGLKINRIILGQELTSEDIIALLEGKKTRLIKGFKSSKTKRSFDAYLKLHKTGKISFSFPPRNFKKSSSKAAAES